MTSNIGTEYINLKQAKYNRDMRTKSSGVNTVYSANVRNEARNMNNVSVSRTKTVSAPVNAEAKVKDVIGLAVDELIRIAAQKRKQTLKARANEPKYITKTVKETKAFPISVLGYIIVFSAIAMFLVLGNSKINESTLRIDNLKSAIADEISAGEILSATLNQRNDASYVENYAVNVLGMVKSTDVAKRYVSISGEDKEVVSSPTGTVSYNDTGATLMLDSIN